MRRLIVLSSKRCGTNLATDYIRHAPNVLALHEIFNPRGVFGLEGYQQAGLSAARRRFGDPALTEQDPRLIEWARNEPGGILEMLEDVARSLGRDGLAFVVFRDQLEQAVFADLVKEPRTTPLFLVRRQLPRYVSLVKAQITDRWKRHDTSALKPSVSLEKFRVEAARVRKWNSRAHFLTRDNDLTSRLVYEDHLCCDSADAFEHIRRAVPWLGRPTGPISTNYFKQDRSTDIFDAISNGAALRAELEQSAEMAEAMSYPDEPPDNIPVSRDA